MRKGSKFIFWGILGVSLHLGVFGAMFLFRVGMGFSL